MPFSLITALAAFQYIMDMLLSVQHYRFIRAYFNNIVIAFRTLNKYVLYICNVLKAITNDQFNINTNKSTLFAKKLRTLGFILSGMAIQLNSEKINIIRNFPILQEVLDICQFIDLASFCKKFIIYFAKIAKPLTN